MAGCVYTLARRDFYNNTYIKIYVYILVEINSMYSVCPGLALYVFVKCYQQTLLTKKNIGYLVNLQNLDWKRDY